MHLHPSEGLLWLVTSLLIITILCATFILITKSNQKKMSNFDQSIKDFKTNDQIIRDDGSSSVKIIKPPYDWDNES